MQKHPSPLPFCEKYAIPFSAVYCGKVLLGWAHERGAAYFLLNCDTAPRERFRSRLGFVPNGRDEQGECLMLRPPEESGSVTAQKSFSGADN